MASIYRSIIDELEGRKDRSAWGRAVTEDALDMMEGIGPECADDFPANTEEIERLLLNGAADWSAYSYGGSALIYDADIAERYCTPSELKNRRGGELPPNRREGWLDVQARALHQACRRIQGAARRAAKYEAIERS